jgi:hypothetical protein
MRIAPAKIHLIELNRKERQEREVQDPCFALLALLAVSSTLERRLV